MSQIDATSTSGATSTHQRVPIYFQLAAARHQTEKRGSQKRKDRQLATNVPNLQIRSPRAARDLRRAMQDARWGMDLGAWTMYKNHAVYVPGLVLIIVPRLYLARRALCIFSQCTEHAQRYNHGGGVLHQLPERWERLCREKSGGQQWIGHQKAVWSWASQELAAAGSDPGAAC